MTEQQIIDQAGDVVEERVYATLGDLCEPPPIKEVQISTANGPRWIKYRPWVPADKLAEFQRLARAGNTRGRGEIDVALYMALVAKYCLIAPKVKTDKEVRDLRRANGSFLVSLVNEVTDTEFLSSIREDLGNEFS